MKRFYNNTLIGGAFSKALRVIALLCVLLGVSSSAWGSNIPASTTLYMDAGDWNKDDARFAVYFCDNGEEWVSMTHVTGNIFKVTSPNKSFPKMIFVRMNGGNQTNDWNNKWNQTKDITDYSTDKNLCTITDHWNNNNASWTWSTYNAGGGGGDTPSSGGHKGTNVGFWDNEAWNIKVGDTWKNQSGYGAEGNTEIDLGTISAGATIGFWTQTWKKKDVANVCQPRVYVKLTKESTTIRNYDHFELSYQSESESGGSVNQLWLKDNVFSLPTESGTYQMKVYFEMWGNESSKDGCNQLSYKLNNGEGNYIFNFTIGGGSGGGDEEIDGSKSFECESIEIWCRTSNGNLDMWCYGWTNNNTELFGKWRGSKADLRGVYDNKTYAVWKTSGHDQINVIFSSEEKNAQTGDLTGYKKGNRVIFEINDNYNGVVGDVKQVSCGGGAGETVNNGTVYLDISNLQDWANSGAVLKVKITYKKGGSEEIELTQCATDNKIFFVDEIIDLNSISKIEMLRYDEKGTGLWNHTGDITFNPSTNCVKLTSWNGEWANYSLTGYSGECGVASSSPVLIAKEAVVADDGKTVTLSGYLQETFCANISEYGFIYCGGSATKGCTPTKNSPKIKVTSGAQLYRGETFSVTTTLPVNTTYGYKAYIMVGEIMYISSETGFFTLGDCTDRPKNTSTITYTVDASLGEEFADPCTLTYGNLQTAIDHLRNANDPDLGLYQYVEKDGDSYNLKQPVVMKVVYYDDTPNDDTQSYIYRGTSSVGKYAGNNKPKNSNLLENINLTATDDSRTLTIKAGNKVAKPWVHHIVLRKSRNIVLDSLCIFSDPVDYDAAKDGKQTAGDNALEMDINVASGDAGWNSLNNQSGTGLKENYLDNANIVVRNCMIGSDGFTGIHISSYNGVTFKNNDFESVFDKGTDNDINYGASAKFLYCKNIKFIENNFRGDHATLMWIQEVQNMLVMNNVFWNTNKYLQKSGTHVPAAMRVVTQWNPTKNIGFYYNTYYFALNDQVSDSKYNFLHFSHTVSGGSGSYNLNTMYFKYNNCYSYDTDCPGSEAISLGGYDDNFCPNNFWSKKQGADFSFAKGCNTEVVDVASQVCKTTATDPSSLMVKGTGLNKGSKPNQDELNKIGISLTNEELISDRYYSNVRPDGNTWTYGAYQSKDDVPVSKIYWRGKTSDWDDRGNWEFDYEDPTTKEITRIKTSCVNTFTEDLEVVIEEVSTTEFTDGRKWPKVPDNFTSGRLNYEDNEHVNAGATSANKGSKFADKITLEYGAGIIGVENLKNGERHYSAASIGFTAPRKQWILVGTVVKPWDKELGNYRNMKSGDYFITGQTPHVYMHKAEIVDGRAMWDETFTSLETSVEPTTVFAIQVPDQYGKYKLAARYFNRTSSKQYDPDEPIEYGVYEGSTGPFTGIFVNEAELPTYIGLTAKQPVLLNNTYPANIDADLLEDKGLGTVQYYNYESGTFLNTDATTEQVLLKPQHGFIFTPNNGGNFTVPEDVFVNGNTRSRSVKAEMPTLSLNLFNANTGVGYSNVVVKVDEMLADNEQALTNVEKVFSPNTESPELYIVANDAMYSRYTVNANTKVIPLGVKLKQDMNIKFIKEYFTNYENVTLVDIHTGVETDILRNSYTTETLVAGDIEGRFFLHLSLNADTEDDDDIENGDDNVSTEVEEDDATNGAINIFVDESNIIRVVTNGVELQTIYVSDMAGKTMKYNVKGYAATLNLPVAQGVYTLNVIGDKANRTEKVILK